LTGATRELASFVAATGFADLPADLVEQAKIFVLDNLAVGLIGSVQPWSEMIASTVHELGGSEQASVFNRGWRTDVSRATLVNGVMLGAFEAEHVGHAAHPSASVFPAALAIAESSHADGRAFLAAMLLGYEVVCRVGAAQTRATEDERGFHNPGVNGVFGAAAAVGKVLGLNADQLASGFGVAGSHASGLIEFVFEGAMTKRLHPGRAAQLGLESALFAQAGFRGPTTVLEGQHGYLRAYSPSPRPERLVVDLGRTWLAADVTPKAYPCHSTHQAVVHAIQQFKRRQPFDADSLERVVVQVEPRAADERFQERQPRTLLGAQYSLPFACAMALTRDLSNPYTYDESALSDAMVLQLASRVEVEATTSPQAVILDLNGQRHTLPATDYPGSVEQPLDFASAVDKLRRYAAPLLGEERVARVADLVSRLDHLEDVSPLAESVTAAGALAR
jgi:2-methylcitrate dehydratase PrpD